MFEPTLRQRLDAANCILFSDDDVTYRHALSANTSALSVLRRVYEVTNSKYKVKSYMTLPIAGLIVIYHNEYSHVGHRVSYAGPNGTISIHFLQFVLKHLPEGSDLAPLGRRLRRMIERAIAIWQEANPGVVPEPELEWGGPRAGHVI